MSKKLIITWQVDDGYAGRRPQTTTVNLDTDYHPDDYADQEDLEAIAEDETAYDFRNRIGFSITKTEVVDD